MHFDDQKIIPAIRNMRDFEYLLKSDYKYLVLLDSHIAQLKNIVDHAKQEGKFLLLHADLIQGLKSDEQGTQFIAQEIKPAGLISTRSQVITTAKKKGLLAIQRLFLLDTNALETSYKVLTKTKPDYIEVLPGILPAHIFTEIKGKIGVPILAGGLIRTKQEVESVLGAGITAITTSDRDLW